jgi:hypothetical protein
MMTPTKVGIYQIEMLAILLKRIHSYNINLCLTCVNHVLTCFKHTAYSGYIEIQETNLFLLIFISELQYKRNLKHSAI